MHKPLYPFFMYLKKYFLDFKMKVKYFTFDIFKKKFKSFEIYSSKLQNCENNKSQSFISNLNFDNKSSTPNNNEFVLVKYKRDNESSDSFYKQIKSIKITQVQKRREMHSLLLFIFFLFVTIITLSQILVMHSQTNGTNFYQIKLMQEDLKQMDTSIDKMVNEKHVLPMNVWYALKHYNQNINKIHKLIEQNLKDDATHKDIFINNIQECLNFTIMFKKQYISNNINKLENTIKSDLTSNQAFNELYDFLSKIISKLTDDKKIYYNDNKIENLLTNYINIYRKLIPKLNQNLKKEFLMCYKSVLKVYFNNPNIFEKSQLYNLDNNILYTLNINTTKNLRVLLERYEISLKENFLIDLNKSFCDAQPPLLCKNITISYYI